MEQRVESVQEEVSNGRGEQDGGVRFILREIAEQKSRENNLLVFGIEEGSGPTAESDLVKLNSLTGELGVSFKLDQVASVRGRIGKEKDGGTRPILVSFRNMVARETVLETNKKLMALGSKLRIKPDSTRMQREEDSRLQKDAEAKNATSPSDAHGEYRMRLVGPPGHRQVIKERDRRKWPRVYENR